MTSLWLGAGQSGLSGLARTKSEVSRRGKLGSQGLWGETATVLPLASGHIHDGAGQQEVRELWTPSTLLDWGHREGGGAFHASNPHPATRLVIRLIIATICWWRRVIRRL